jgi:hypothetical protein
MRATEHSAPDDATTVVLLDGAVVRDRPRERIDGIGEGDRDARRFGPCEHGRVARHRRVH